jgi:hypothetical protein
MTTAEIDIYTGTRVKTPEVNEYGTPSHHGLNESQLEGIITSAREIAIAAEEIMRELIRMDDGQGADPATAKDPSTLKGLAIAPRLLASSQEQLETVLRMLRQD